MLHSSSNCLSNIGLFGGRWGGRGVGPYPRNQCAGVSPDWDASQSQGKYRAPRPMGILNMLFHLSACLHDCGRKPKSSWATGGQHTNSTYTNALVGFDPSALGKG